MLVEQAFNELLDRRIEETTADLRQCYAKVLRIDKEKAKRQVTRWKQQTS